MSREPIRTIAVVGATSAIARETLRRFQADGAAMVLVGRTEAKLRALTVDLDVRGADLRDAFAADLVERGEPARVAERILSTFDPPDLLLVAHGEDGDRPVHHADPGAAVGLLRVNLESVVALVTPIAARMEAVGRGRIAVIGSVAGDRGRQSNYVYGAAKGGLAVYLAGLRNRLHFAGVGVTTVKAGWVDTEMTADVPADHPLMVGPERAGRAIHRAIVRGKDVAYVPWFWRFIMLVVRAIPEPVFKRLHL